MRKSSLLKSIFSFIIIPLLIVSTLSLSLDAASILPEKISAIPSDPAQAKTNTVPNANFSITGLPQIPDIKAEAAIVVDSERGQILYSKEYSKKIRSSVANKIMTALVVIESSPLDTKITISKESVSAQTNTVNFETGGKYSVEDLLYALMLVSSNQSANVLAEHISGSVEKFSEVMNKKAIDLGMKNTNFTNASGAYNENQYTTTQDVSILVRYALKNSYFKNYFFSTKARPLITEVSSNILINQNQLFWMYDGISGGTHGYFDSAFQSTATLAQKGIQTLITIVINSHQADVFDESIELFDYGFANFKKDLLVGSGQSLKSVIIEGKTVNLITMENNYYTFPIGEYYIKSLEFIDKTIELPVKKDYSLSTARYILTDDTIIDILLYPDTEISAPANLKSVLINKLTTYKDILILLIFLGLLEFAFIIYNTSRLIKRTLARRKNT